MARTKQEAKPVPKTRKRAREEDIVPEKAPVPEPPTQKFFLVQRALQAHADAALATILKHAPELEPYRSELDVVCTRGLMSINDALWEEYWDLSSDDQ
jgi:hypothetical protein